MKDKAIKVDYLARVEGEGALYIKVKNGYVVDVKVKIFEPPRFFEAFLRGRSFREVPDITARICGICPVAYQMSSIHAIEGIFGVKVTEQIRMLRRLIYCASYITPSHSSALHFLGEIFSLTLSTKISAPPPGIDCKPASINLFKTSRTFNPETSAICKISSGERA